jgi:hypothetical protein
MPSDDEDEESLEEDDTFDFLKSKKGAKNLRPQIAKTNAPPSVNTSMEGALRGNQNILNNSVGGILGQRQAQKEADERKALKKVGGELSQSKESNGSQRMPTRGFRR